MTSTLTAPIDTDRAQAFAGRMLQRINDAGTLLMTSIGHRTGLFDALARRGPSTTAELAAAAGLNERYVREWLGAMVAGDVVTMDATTQRYELPREHAQWLTRDARPNNIAVSAQWIAVLGGVEDRIVECFVKGGGLAYEEYPRFHQVMAEESDQSVVAALESSIVPLVPGLAARLAQGIDVIDIGCGSGRAVLELARLFPKGRFTGVDVSREAIDVANAEARRRGVTNVNFEVRDVANLGAVARYDLVTAFDAIHDQAAPDRVLLGIQRALRPGGTFLMQDIKAETPHAANQGSLLGAFVYTISCMHCMSVSLGQDGMGLGAAWGREKALEMLAAAGFDRVAVNELPHDLMNFWFVAHKR